MDCLAESYRASGRHADALAMGERLLEFRHRVLSEDHPEIGEGRVMSDALHVLLILMGRFCESTCRQDNEQSC